MNYYKTYQEMTYKIYLEKNGYTIRTSQTYQKAVSRFEEWCVKYGTQTETIDYKTFLKYIEQLRKSNLKPRTLKGYIAALKTYFNYLVEENYRLENIIQNINIKGVKQQVIHNILTSDELEDLYYSYQTEIGNPLTRKRNKIMLGLFVYQGLTTSNLQRLQVENVQLYKGKIDILGTKKSNGRLLELKPWQLMELMEYINEVRPRILEQTNKETEQLFLPLGSSLKLQNSLAKITKELKAINHNYIDAKQIRTSVIVNWLKQHNLRKVQYLAGHRYISSTERYQQDDLESLHKTINTFHPFS